MPRAHKVNSKGPRMIQEILRLKALGLSKRMIAKALDCSRNTVDKYLAEGSSGVSAAAADYKAPWSEAVAWERVHSETSQGTALSDVWESMSQAKSELAAVPYVSFWREYRRRFPNIPLDFHKIHPPGERCEVDYKGDSPGLGYIDRASGAYVPCRLFGAVLCFSQLFFPRATLAEKQGDWLRSMAEAYSYFGGVALTTAFDNAKAAVTKAHRYDPDINKEFAYFAEHHGTAPLAMRPRKPKDKNLIENALGVFWRWARRRISSRTFYCLGDLNEYLRELAGIFNDRVQRKYGVSRRQKFEAGERSKLLPLPTMNYSAGEWRAAKVHPDCHIQVEKNFYSVPYQRRGKELDIRVTSGLIEVYFQLDCIARHLRASGNTIGQYKTINSHLPPSHQAMNESTPQMAINEAVSVGPNTEIIVKALIEQARHPLMYLRRVQGILRLSKRYTKADLEASCMTLVKVGITQPKLADVESIIKSNIDPKSAAVIPMRRGPNPYLRGQNSWRQETTGE